MHSTFTLPAKGKKVGAQLPWITGNSKPTPKRRGNRHVAHIYASCLALPQNLLARDDPQIWLIVAHKTGKSMQRNNLLPTVHGAKPTVGRSFGLVSKCAIPIRLWRVLPENRNPFQVKLKQEGVGFNGQQFGQEYQSIKRAGLINFVFR